MKEKDGIDIAEGASWELGYGELWTILFKRAIALPAKLLGFKPFCLYLATWLLVEGYLPAGMWLAVLLVVLFGIMGLKALTRWKGGT